MNKLDKIIMGFRDYSKAHKFRLENKFSSNILIQSKEIIFDFLIKFIDIENSIEIVNYSDFIIKRIDYFKDKAILIDMSEAARLHHIETDFRIKLQTARMFNIRLFLIYPVKSIWDVPSSILDYCNFTVDSLFQVYYKVYTDDLTEYDFLILDLSCYFCGEEIITRYNTVLKVECQEYIPDGKWTESFELPKKNICPNCFDMIRHYFAHFLGELRRNKGKIYSK